MIALPFGRAALALVLAAGAAQAAPVATPSQSDWDGARQALDLPGGPRLTFVELGKSPGSAQGVPVLLLHGYTDNSRSWSLPAPALAKALPGRRILALDLRGHGGSEAPACCYDPGSLAHDVDAAMTALGIGQADLVGHSLGSITAATLAASQPQRVRRLVLVSSATATPEATLDWLWDNVPALSAPIDPDSAFMKDWFANPNPVDPDFLSHERKDGAKVPLHVWNGVLLGLSGMDWSYLARRIQAPVTILWGDQDVIFDAPTQDRLRQVLPKASFHEIKDRGHNFFWEDPEGAAGLIAGAIGD